jgi:hypothetical protein
MKQAAAGALKAPDKAGAQEAGLLKEPLLKERSNSS